jgi:hypothetical protein
MSGKPKSYRPRMVVDELYVRKLLTTQGAQTLDSATLASAIITSLTLGSTAITATGAEINKLAGATLTTTELNKLAGVTAGIVSASKALVVGASKELNELPIIQTIATADLGTVRLLHAQAVASNAHISAGTLAAVRGLTTLSGVIDTGGAYLYGTQGKLVVTGTMNHADSRLTAGISQLDVTGATLTAGQLSGHWIDIVGGNGAGGGQFNALRITANKDSKPASIIYGQLNASFLMDLVTPSGTTMDYVAAAGTAVGSAGAATGVAAKVALVRIDGTTYYIPLFTGNGS